MPRSWQNAFFRIGSQLLNEGVTALEASEMKNHRSIRHLAAGAALVTVAAAALSPVCATAQSLSDEWKFRAVIYMWMPRISGGANFSNGTTADFEVNFRSILDHLKLAGMGSIEAQKGRWGAFTDVIYMNLGGTKATTHNLTVDGLPVPVDANVTANVGIKAWIWTLAGSYRIQAEPDSTFDVFGGARMLWLQPTLNYGITASVGPLAGLERTGNLEVTGRNWDAIVGAKGRAGFGDNHEWFIPYYVDVGTGQSKFTWQGMAGIGYAFSWGDIVATWRYLDYNTKSGHTLNDLTINGPLIGVAFSW